MNLKKIQIRTGLTFASTAILLGACTLNQAKVDTTGPCGAQLAQVVDAGDRYKDPIYSSGMLGVVGDVLDKIGLDDLKGYVIPMLQTKVMGVSGSYLTAQINSASTKSELYSLINDDFRGEQTQIELSKGDLDNLFSCRKQQIKVLEKDISSNSQLSKQDKKIKVDKLKSSFQEEKKYVNDLITAMNSRIGDFSLAAVYAYEMKQKDFKEERDRSKKSSGLGSFGSLSGPKFLDYVVTSRGGRVNLRTGPSLKRKVQFTLPKGSELKIKAGYENDLWIPVLYKSTTGYMYSKYLASSDSEEAIKTINEQKVAEITRSKKTISKGKLKKAIPEAKPSLKKVNNQTKFAKDSLASIEKEAEDLWSGQESEASLQLLFAKLNKILSSWKNS